MQRYINLIQNNKVEVRYLGLYIAFGLLALCVELALFSLAINVLNFGVALANLVAVGSGAAISFSANALVNFGTKDKVAKRLVSYLAVITMGYFISTSLILVLVHIGFAAILAKGMSLQVVFILQYGLNRKFTFSR